MKPIIKVENIAKQYHVNAARAPQTSLREYLTDSARSSVGKVKQLVASRGRGSVSAGSSFWALKDVSFEVAPGEVVGIIGRNGAGKSTLLKILSRITEPTRGRIDLYGRVGSLLEVGTGFHPDLSGRENVFLNGAILGMKRAEITAKFDEIVAFAELERFIDTPVKRYSSGMYMRLAFAVAAHLEPEILVVDEVLAVGDVQFQKKCLGKMGEVAQEGRTVIFVSHQMSAIERLCSRGIYLKTGCVEQEGRTEEVIARYMTDARVGVADTSLRERRDRQGSGKVRIVGFYILDSFGVEQRVLKAGYDYTFVMECEMGSGLPALDNVVGSIALTDNRNETVFLVRSSFTNENFRLSGSAAKIECRVRDFSLATGEYISMLFLSHGEAEILDFVEQATEVLVEGGDFFGSGSDGLPSHCKVLTRAEWTAR